MTARVVVVVSALALAAACEKSTTPDCEDDAGVDCPAPRDGGTGTGFSDADPFDGSLVDFDAGDPGAPVCRSQFELCSGPSDCCAPYTCSSGTCR